MVAGAVVILVASRVLSLGHASLRFVLGALRGGAVCCDGILSRLVAEQITTADALMQCGEEDLRLAGLRVGEITWLRNHRRELERRHLEWRERQGPQLVAPAPASGSVAPAVPAVPLNDPSGDVYRLLAAAYGLSSPKAPEDAGGFYPLKPEESGNDAQLQQMVGMTAALSKEASAKIADLESRLRAAHAQLAEKDAKIAEQAAAIEALQKMVGGGAPSRRASSNVNVGRLSPTRSGGMEPVMSVNMDQAASLPVVEGDPDVQGTQGTPFHTMQSTLQAHLYDLDASNPQSQAPGSAPLSHAEVISRNDLYSQPLQGSSSRASLLLRASDAALSAKSPSFPPESGVAVGVGVIIDAESKPSFPSVAKPSYPSQVFESEAPSQPAAATPQGGSSPQLQPQPHTSQPSSRAPSQRAHQSTASSSRAPADAEARLSQPLRADTDVTAPSNSPRDPESHATSRHGRTTPPLSQRARASHPSQLSHHDSAAGVATQPSYPSAASQRVGPHFSAKASSPGGTPQMHAQAPPPASSPLSRGGGSTTDDSFTECSSAYELYGSERPEMKKRQASAKLEQPTPLDITFKESMGEVAVPVRSPVTPMWDTPAAVWVAWMDERWVKLAAEPLEAALKAAGGYSLVVPQQTQAEMSPHTDEVVAEMDASQTFAMGLNVYTPTNNANSELVFARFVDALDGDEGLSPAKFPGLWLPAAGYLDLFCDDIKESFPTPGMLEHMFMMGNQLCEVAGKWRALPLREAQIAAFIRRCKKHARETGGTFSQDLLDDARLLLDALSIADVPTAVIKSHFELCVKSTREPTPDEIVAALSLTVLDWHGKDFLLSLEQEHEGAHVVTLTDVAGRTSYEVWHIPQE
eukprot:TRINITY_DN484_c5_g1_i1.p1 TRINITY_DN484_c5_g1~~TRINITY_DN484_c5_g1_i1.p1  ORF type:complete len:906 (+),score=321.69 TRINITY_DN484_c5_g1_i1:131-2719(+)